uniref:Tumor necrosis factor receptor superfamily member 6B-like n=1 Tax=Mastacembelus armatus TaxID=205130 RepID=A0A3Q3N303_9TELE
MLTMVSLSLFPVVLLFLRTVQVGAVAAPVLKFRETDPVTGNSVECDRCQPGTYLRARCTATTMSVCAPCPPGSFTELWNHIGKCLRCGVCGQNQVERSACTADRDCQCQCVLGYYYEEKYEMCLRHKTCPSGQGVLTEGTPENDTACHVCPNGTFSDNVSAHHNCTQHLNCEAAGLKLVLKGAAWHDSVCASSTELTSKNSGDYLREIVPAFFVHHKPHIRRLRRIVHKLPSKDSRKQEGTAGLNLPALLERINTWVASATSEQIQQLPDLLTKAGADNAGERLHNKMQRIESNLKELRSLGNEICCKDATIIHYTRVHTASGGGLQQI